jgi:predicted nucleotidyltransferase component of viral defense system
MFLNSLKNIYQKNKEKNLAYVRNILKEHIQYYVLQFISQSVWVERFIFKGGTCLHFFFDLPRLSEDLDFDITNIQTFDINKFIKELKIYFVSTVQYDTVDIKLANNKRTFYVRFSILRDIGMPIAVSESNVVFVRIDIAPVVGTTYSTEIAIKSIYDFSLLIKRYSLPDLFSGKIAAIITREAFEGTIKKERIKGRDYYDLIWFLEKNIQPNWKYLSEITGFTKKEVLQRLGAKIEKAEPSLLQTDLMPFFQDNTFVRSFSQNIKSLYLTYVKTIA